MEFGFQYRCQYLQLVYLRPADYAYLNAKKMVRAVLLMNPTNLFKKFGNECSDCSEYSFKQFTRINQYLFNTLTGFGTLITPVACSVCNTFD